MKKSEPYSKPSHDVKVSPVSESENTPRVNMLKNNWIPLAFIGVLLVLFGAIRLLNGPTVDLNTMKTKTLPDLIKKVANPGTKIQILSVKETNGLVEFELTVNGQKYTSYISKDGKLLFTSAIKVDDIAKAQANTNASAPKTATAAEIKKSDKPNLTAFVVAQCPYGLQMQRAIKSAISSASDISSFMTVRYIGSVNGNKLSSMHGDQEAAENLRQICIREEQNEKYWPYVSCYMQEGNSESCLGSTGVDTSSLNSCVNDKSRGIAYAQKDFDMAAKFGVQGSPTLIANNSQTVSEYDFGGRNPEAIKSLVCALGTNKPSFCSQTLAKTDVATAFSTTDEPSTAAPAATTGGGCAPATPAK